MYGIGSLFTRRRTDAAFLHNMNLGLAGLGGTVNPHGSHPGQEQLTDKFQPADLGFAIAAEGSLNLIWFRLRMCPIYSKFSSVFLSCIRACITSSIYQNLEPREPAVPGFSVTFLNYTACAGSAGFPLGVRGGALTNSW